MSQAAVKPEQAARAQVVDTVELFHFRRQRKLSLRFLAHRLLGVGIQATSHDSIVDARTALQLFQARLLYPTPTLALALILTLTQTLVPQHLRQRAPCGHQPQLHRRRAPRPVILV